MYHPERLATCHASCQAHAGLPRALTLTLSTQRVLATVKAGHPLECLCAVLCRGLASNQAQTKSDVAQQVQVQVVGELENLSLTDVPRDRLKRSAGSFSQK